MTSIRLQFRLALIECLRLFDRENKLFCLVRHLNVRFIDVPERTSYIVDPAAQAMHYLSEIGLRGLRQKRVLNCILHGNHDLLPDIEERLREGDPELSPNFGDGLTDQAAA